MVSYMGAPLGPCNLLEEGTVSTMRNKRAWFQMAHTLTRAHKQTHPQDDYACMFGFFLAQIDHGKAA